MPAIFHPRHRLLANHDSHRFNSTDSLAIPRAAAGATARFRRSSGGRRRGPRVCLAGAPSAALAQRIAGGRGREHEGRLRRVDSSTSSHPTRSRSAPGRRSGSSFEGGASAFERVHGGESSPTTTGRRRRSGCRWTVGANQSERFTAYARPARASPSSRSGCSIRTAGGWVVRRKTRSCRKLPRSIMPDETLILTMGRPQGVESIAELPGFQAAGRAACVATPASRDRDGADRPSDRLDARPLVRLRRGAGRRPRHRRPRDAGGARRAARSAAGRLGRAGRPSGRSRSVPTGRRCGTASSAPILPGLPSGQEKVASLEALDTFAGSNKPITPPGTPPVMVTKLEELEERGGKVLSVMSNMPLVVRGALRLRPGDLDRARRRPEAVFRLARPVLVLGAGHRLEAPARRAGRRAAPSRAAGRGSISTASPTCRASFASRSSSFRASS